ncbi:FtsX-like permease family protein [Streptomyces celluloflavus]|uniref:FtsX-like permease family protein n=1 Tax=Streptomyces celluloflavus TaxID=58344 RepID=UPI0037A11178
MTPAPGLIAIRAHRITPFRLFVSELRAYPGRVAGAATAFAITAACVSAGVLLLATSIGASTSRDAAVAAQAEAAGNLLSLLLGLLLMSSVMVIGSTLSLWTAQRQSQFAVCRALGVTAGRVRRMIVADVVRLALLTSAVGAALGALPLAAAGHRLLIGAGLFPSTLGLPDAATGLALTAGVCASLCLVGVLAALSAAVAAGRADPIGLLKDDGAALAPRRSRARLITGLSVVVLLCGPIVLVMLVGGLPSTSRAAVAPALALMIIPTLAVLAPWIVPSLTWPVGILLRVVDRRVGRIAAAGLRAAPVRTTAIAVPVLIAVGISVTLLGAAGTVDAAVQRETQQSLRADGVVTADPGTLLPAIAGPYPGGAGTALIATTVTAPKNTAAPFAEFTPPAAGTRAWGVDGDRLGTVLDLGVHAGRMADVKGSAFAVSANQADAQGWQVGRRVRMTLADGTAQTLRLAAVFDRALAFPEFVIPARLALAHTAHPTAEQILLTGRTSTWPVRHGEHVYPRSAYLSSFAPRSAIDEISVRLTVGVVTGYALLAAANTCSLAQRDRRALRSHLRALGLGRFQLLRCVIYEVLGAAAVGLMLAAATALACLMPLASAFGFGRPVLGDWWAAAILAVVLTALVLPGVLTAHPLRGIKRQFSQAAS